MQTSVLLVSLALFAADAKEATADLESPRQIVATGREIDIQREGQACPAFADFDGDGLNDLLVGEAFGGRLRIYRNLGTKQEPKFGDYEWFRAGDTIARVPWARGGYKGFTPQLVDLDGDGKTDIVSGSYDAPAGWLNEFYWFRRIDGTNFAAAQKLIRDDGKPLQLKDGATPSFADWDADGDFDLIIGTGEGGVLLLSNDGTRTNARFAAPVAVAAAGKPIAVKSKSAHPCVADWDGDGKLDLLITALDGSVILYANNGTASQPKFETFITLVDKSPITTQSDNDRPKGIPGKHPAICVADYNGDGLNDLILGDACGRFRGPPENNPREEEVADQNRVELDGLRKEWAASFQKYRELTSRSGSAKAEAKKPEAEIAAARAAMVDLNSRIAAAQLDVEYDWSRYHMHGFVWVFLRKPAAP